ncbi:MAG: hypothetical protein IPK32_04120 [Verrucomicrobiaceae bacterium]|nr:hypothetical protein [Verrucomicrobiaceae bacterium]
MNEKALESYNHAVECALDIFLTRYNRAQRFAKLGRWQDCVDECERIVVEPPRMEHDLIVYAHLGFALACTGKTGEGAKWLHRILQYNPQHFKALKLLGIVHHAQKEMSQARHYLTRANEVEPGDPLVAEVLQASY